MEASRKQPTIVIGNWKMNTTLSEATALARSVVEAARALQRRGLLMDRRLVLMPPFPFLASVGEVLSSSGVGDNLLLGAQDVSSEAHATAFTGDVSAKMLEDLNCAYVLVGHSERRLHHGESDELINAKLARLVGDSEMKAVLCVGETLGERNDHQTENVLRRQLELALANMKEALLGGRMVLAYEPVWAIGTGLTPKPEEVHRTHGFLRGVLSKGFGEGAKETPILYGGSVSPNNIDDLVSLSEVDGVLVGGASLRSENFTRIASFEKSR